MTSLASTAPPLLAVHALCFSRNDMPIFGPLTFTVEIGEALLIRGNNGAGKTTLLRVLSGLLRADSGEIHIDGRIPTHEQRSRHIVYSGHLPAHKADLTASENLQFLCGLHGAHPTRSIGQALRLVGLAGYDDALSRQLSAGQKKRLSLARVWLASAPLWLLDEPYANLDLEGIDLVNRLVREHLETGGAAMVTTHGAYAAPPVRTRELRLAAFVEDAT